MAVTVTPPARTGGARTDPEAPPARRRLREGRPARRRLRRVLLWAALAAVVAAGVLTATAASTPTYAVSAVFSRAPGLFPGAPVQVLGVEVGTVTSVRNVGDQVDVTLAVDRGRALPARVGASLVAPELLGEPSIELDPGYTGGPVLAAGQVIPESRTSVPVSTAQLLTQLQHTLRQINPKAVGDLVTNLAEDLDGQGKALNTLISGAAGTLQVLATKADDLGQLSGSLAQLTGTLDSRTSQLRQLITDYDTVSAVIAQHSTQLGGAITQLTQASTALVSLLVPNLGAVEADVAGTTTVTRTLDRNLTSVDETLSSATALFAGAERAFTAEHEWINLNLQLPTGVTGAVVAGLVRDRLSGVCRRIAANHATGLSATELATLATCGNPASSYFDPIISEIPSVLDAVSSGATPSAPTASQLLQQGLATIPGVPGTAGPSPSVTPPAGGGGTATTATTAATATTTAPAGSSPSSSTTTTQPTTTTTSPTCLGGLLGGLLPCGSGSGSGSSGSGSSGSGAADTSAATGGGSLTAYRTPVTGARSLTPAGQSVLPPLPAGAPGATRTRHAGHRHTGRRQAGGGRGPRSPGATK